MCDVNNKTCVDRQKLGLDSKCWKKDFTNNKKFQENCYSSDKSLVCKDFNTLFTDNPVGSFGTCKLGACQPSNNAQNFASNAVDRNKCR